MQRSLITDHHTMIILKKLEILQELLKCDAETKSEQMLLEKMAPADLLQAELPQTQLKQENETTTTTKKTHNKVKQSIMKYICITK